MTEDANLANSDLLWLERWTETVLDVNTSAMLVTALVLEMPCCSTAVPPTTDYSCCLKVLRQQQMVPACMHITLQPTSA